jgi:S1-C subfamily serine protease
LGVRLLAGTSFRDRHLVALDGAPVLGAFERLRAALRQGAPRAVDLFAEPHPDPREGAPQRATWYGEASADPVPLASLPTTQRLAAEQALRERLEALVPLLADPATAPLLRAALLIAGTEDVLWTGEAPILVNWGVVPAAIERSPEGYAAHFAATLGRFAPPGFAPWTMTAPGAAPAAAPMAAAVAVPAAAAATAAPVAAGGWLGAFGATLAALAVVLLLSGVALVAGYYIGWNRLVARLQAETPPPLDPSLEADMRRLQEGVNEGLRQRIARLERGLEGDVCVAEEGPLPALPPQPGVPGQPTPPGRAEAPRQPALPPPPEQQPIRPPGPEGQAGRAENLADALDRSVVLIVTQRGDGQRGVGIGTGFAIAADLVVTNRHVIEGAATIYAANRALGRPTQAQLVAQTPDHEPGRPDFALLRLPGAQLSPLPVSTEVDRLVPVVAAGFPGFVLGEDDDFRRLLGGESGAIPRAHLTSGEVSSLQPLRGNTVVIHTAAINRGNSGGPLADRCGRVVGVNTFIRTDREVAYRADYALPSAMLLPFLREAGAEITPAAGICQPERAAAPAPPAAPAAPAPAAPAPPAAPLGGAAPR